MKTKYLTGFVFWTLVAVLLVIAFSTSPLLSPECQSDKVNLPEICIS